jgi:hypothetical protein
MQATPHIQQPRSWVEPNSSGMPWHTAPPQQSLPAPAAGREQPGPVIMSARELLTATISPPGEEPQVNRHMPATLMQKAPVKATTAYELLNQHPAQPQQAQPYQADVRPWVAPGHTPQHNIGCHVTWQLHTPAVPVPTHLQVPMHTGPVTSIQEAQQQPQAHVILQHRAAGDLHAGINRASSFASAAVTGVKPMLVCAALPPAASAGQPNPLQAYVPAHSHQVPCPPMQQAPVHAPVAAFNQQQAQGHYQAQHHRPHYQAPPNPSPQAPPDLCDLGGVQLLTPNGRIVTEKRPTEQQSCRSGLGPTRASVGRQPLRQQLSQ